MIQATSQTDERHGSLLVLAVALDAPEALRACDNQRTVESDGAIK